MTRTEPRHSIRSAGPVRIVLAPEPLAPPRRPAWRRLLTATPLTIPLLVLPLLVTAFRRLPWEAARTLDAELDLTTLPAALHDHVQTVLIVPLGALVVVLCRLTLGIRALGVISPVLLGIAFATTGFGPGVLFLVLVLAIASVVVRPVLRSHGLPFSARVAALLSTVAILMIAPLLVLRHVPSAHAAQFVYFPPVALGLVTERFASTTAREGARTAAARTTVTIAEAVVIAFVAVDLGAVRLLVRDPELLLVQMWLVLLVSLHLSPRLVEERLAGRRSGRRWLLDRRRIRHAPTRRKDQSG